MKRITILLTLFVLTFSVYAQTFADISNIRKISATQGGFTGELNEGDLFFRGVTIGDIDGDGIEDIAVGAPYDDDGFADAGAVWILFMNEDRTVKGHQKISATSGGFTGELKKDDFFGRDISSIGDFNKDGVPDIVVGARGDDDGGIYSGAVWLLFLNSDGTVKSHQKISATQGGLVGLTSNRQFGFGVTSLGDLDGDGITDIAVGSPTYDNDGGLYRGCVWILFLNSDGTVKSQQKINDYQGGFSGVLDDHDRFGLSLQNIGDINNDGVIDIAVHAYYDDDGAFNAGALYILFLKDDGTVKHTQKISNLEGDFNGFINADDSFGYSIVSLGDIDGDGINDILVGSPRSDDGGRDRGKAWILFMNNNGTVKDFQEINSLNPLLSDAIDDGDWYGGSVGVFSGFNSNGKKEIIVGAPFDDDGATDAGAVYIIDLDVKHKPVALAGDNQEVCNGSQIVLDASASSVLDNDPLSYYWECAELDIINQNTILNVDVPVVDQLTTFHFVLTVTCQGIASDNDTVLVTVYPYPYPNKPIISFSENILTSTEAANYQWYFNNEIIENASKQSYSPVESGNYHVVVSNEIGCLSEQSDQVAFNMNPVAVISGFSTVCSGSTIFLNANSSHMPNQTNVDFTYLWSSNSMMISNNSLNELMLVAPQVESNTQIEFYLQVFNNDLGSEIDTLIVTVIPAPSTPSIEQYADTLLSTLASSYQWYHDGLEVNGATDSTLIIGQSGNYQVKIINESGCVSDISVPIVFTKTSIKTNSNKLKVFPNPTDGVINIVGLDQSKEVSIFVYDQLGRLSYQVTTENGNAIIDLKQHKRGLYFIHLDNQQEPIKILKE